LLFIPIWQHGFFMFLYVLHNFQPRFLFKVPIRIVFPLKFRRIFPRIYSV
jgi:hypothetical protein